MITHSTDRHCLKKKCQPILASIHRNMFKFVLVCFSSTFISLCYDMRMRYLRQIVNTFASCSIIIHVHVLADVEWLLFCCNRVYKSLGHDTAIQLATTIKMSTYKKSSSMLTRRILSI